MVIRARVPEHIEIQGRRANDIKHSANWEATQVFLQFPFLWFKFLLSAFNYVGLMFLSVIRIPFWILLSGLVVEGTGVDPFMQSTTNVQRVKITQVKFSLISDHDSIDVHFGPFRSRRDVGSQSRDVETSRRRNVVTSV